MGATFELHSGTIRFGPEHHSFAARDPWTGCLSLIADLYDPALCHLFAIAGKVRLSDHRDILRLVASMGYTRMQETHNGQKLETDLTCKPFKRRKI